MSTKGGIGSRTTKSKQILIRNLASRLTRISSNPTVEVLIEGELNAAKLDEIAREHNHDGFRNPTEIIIGRGVTGISGDLLSGAGVDAKRLQTFGFKSGPGHKCQSIGNAAFRSCFSLDSVVIGNSVITIGTDAFRNCSSLDSVVIGDSVTTIGDYAFNTCSSLASVVIGNSVTSIGNDAFVSCSSLASVVIPDSVTIIGNYAFESCSSLASVVIGDSVETIGTSAFVSCSTLESVNIPDSVTFISSSAFAVCPSLASVTFTPGSTDYQIVLGSDVFNSTPLASQFDEGVITIPSDNDNRYTVTASSYPFPTGVEVTITGQDESGNNTYDKIIIFPTSLDVTAFNDEDSRIEREEISLVTLFSSSIITSPNLYSFKVYTGNYTSIGYDAFRSCSQLASVVIPDSVRTIDYSAFRSCSQLESVVIGNSVRTIDYAAFAYCSSLTSVDIPDSVITIGDYAFYQCSNLASVDIGDSVTSIGSYAFRGSNLASVDIPDSVTSIGGSAFRACSNLASVDIPDSVTTIDYAAFAFCTSLTSVEIPNSVTTIDDGAFFECTKLESVVIGNSVTSISNITFRLCSNLTSVVIGNSVKSIEYKAFDDCSALNKVTFTKDPNSDYTIYLGRAAFGNSGVESQLSEGVITINRDAPSYTVTPTVYPFIIGTNITILGRTAPITIDPSELSVSAFNAATPNFLISEDSLVSFRVNKGNFTSIGNSAFANCSELDSITFNESGNDYRILLGSNVFGNTDVARQFDQLGLTNGGVITITSANENGYTVTADDYPFQTRVEVTITGEDESGNDTYETFTIYPNSLDVTAFNVADSRIQIEQSEYNISRSPNLYSFKVYTGNYTTIDTNAFLDCDSLVSVDIPDSVITIGTAAFFSCSVLTSVNIPDSVTIIGEAAFVYCSSLRSVVIGNSVETIGNNAFASCFSLNSVTFTPGSTDYQIMLGSNVFNDTDLASQFDEGVITIPSTSPNDNYTVTASSYPFPRGVEVTITGQDNPIIVNPESLNSSQLNGLDPTNLSLALLDTANSAITQGNLVSFRVYTGNYTTVSSFANCASLEEINIPISVNTIGVNAFQRCLKLASLFIPFSVTTIGANAFEDCTGLETFTMDDFSYLNSIGDSAFAGCTKLASLESLTSLVGDLEITTNFIVNNNAFFGCTALTSLTIPTWMTSVGSNAFSDCTNLKTLTLNTIPNTISSITAFGLTNIETVNIGPSVASINNEFFRDTSLQTVNFASNSTLATIGQNAFNDCRNITALKIPDSVRTIGQRAFAGCNNLATFEFGTNIQFTTIDQGVFANCSKLQEIVIPDSVETINQNAFNGCNSLRKLSITGNSNLGTIEGLAFQDCSALSLLNIPNRSAGNENEITINANAFNNCTNLVNVEFGDNTLADIGSGAFNLCTSLAKVVIGTSDNGITIDGSAFANCTRLEILDINSNVNRSSQISGLGTDSLELVNIGPDVTTIASGLFASCVNLQIVNFGDNSTVDTIGASAFSNCSQLTAITFPNSLRNINDSAFFNCSQLTAITFPNSLRNINDSAFADCTQLAAVTFTPGSSDYQIVLGSDVFGGTPLANQFDEGVITIPSANENGYRVYIPDPSDLTAEGTLTYPFPRGVEVIVINDDGFGNIIYEKFTVNPESLSLQELDVAKPVGKPTIDRGSLVSFRVYTGNYTSIGGSAICDSAICDYPFQNCLHLTSVEIPSSVTNIYDQAFANWVNLREVTFKARTSNCTIGENAFFTEATPEILMNSDDQILNDAENIPANSNDNVFNIDADGDGVSNGEDPDPLNPNTDGDMLADGVEVLYTYTNPTDSNDPANISETGLAVIDTDGNGVVTINEFTQDTDGDGVTNGVEVFNYGTNPNNPDTDGDGLADGVEVMILGTDANDSNDPANISETGLALIDTNHDDLVTINEVNAAVDTDGDMLADGVEVLFTNTDPTNSNDPANISETGLAFIDTNNDGVVTINEFYTALAQDTDFDGLADGEEVLSTNTNPNNPDTDGDNLTDGVEVIITNTDPTQPNTVDIYANTVDIYDPFTVEVDGNLINVSGDYDGDVVPDGAEIFVGTNPLNPDTDGDGLDDGVDPNPLVPNN